MLQQTKVFMIIKSCLGASPLFFSQMCQNLFWCMLVLSHLTTDLKLQILTVLQVYTIQIIIAASRRK